MSTEIHHKLLLGGGFLCAGTLALIFGLFLTILIVTIFAVGAFSFDFYLKNQNQQIRLPAHAARKMKRLSEKEKLLRSSSAVDNSINNTVTDENRSFFVQSAGGPLLSPEPGALPRIRRMNVNMNRSFEMPIQSSSFNISGYAKQQKHYPTHLPRYSLGLFPTVKLSRTPRPVLNEKNSTMIHSPVTVKVAPPDTFTVTSPIVTRSKVRIPIGTGESNPCDTQTVLSALREKRKRNMKDDVEGDVSVETGNIAKRRRQSGGEQAQEPVVLPAKSSSIPNGNIGMQLESRPTLKRPMLQEDACSEPPFSARGTPVKKIKPDNSRNSIISSYSSTKRFLEKQASESIGKRQRSSSGSSSPSGFSSQRKSRNTSRASSRQASPSKALEDDLNTNNSNCSEDLTTSQLNSIPSETRSSDSGRSTPVMGTPKRKLLADVPGRRRTPIYGPLSNNFAKIPKASFVPTLEDFEKDRLANEERVRNMLAGLEKTEKKKPETEPATSSKLTLTSSTVTTSVSVANTVSSASGFTFGTPSTSGAVASTSSKNLPTEASSKPLLTQNAVSTGISTRSTTVTSISSSDKLSSTTSPTFEPVFGIPGTSVASTVVTDSTQGGTLPSYFDITGTKPAVLPTTTTTTSTSLGGYKFDMSKIGDQVLATNNVSSSKPSSTIATSSFSFGAKQSEASTSNTSLFADSSKQVSTASSGIAPSVPSSTSFQFGQSKTAATSSVSQTTPSSSSFQFGQSSVTAPTSATGMFQLSSAVAAPVTGTGQANQSNFNFGGTTSAPSVTSRDQTKASVFGPIVGSSFGTNVGQTQNATSSVLHSNGAVTFGGSSKTGDVTTNSGFIFGANPAQTAGAFSMPVTAPFGTQAAAQPSKPGSVKTQDSGIFGLNSNPTTKVDVLGLSNTQSSETSFWGAPSSQNTQTSTFGSPSMQAPTVSTFGTIGGSTEFSFGTQEKRTQPSIFGPPSTQTAQVGVFGTTGIQSSQATLFGTLNTQTAQAGTFGTPSTQTAQAGTFGTPSTQTAQTGAFGTLGTQSAQATAFGTPITQTVQASPFGTPSTQITKGSVFGAPSTQNSQVSLFATPDTQSTQTRLFGAPSTQTSQSSVFGASSAQTTQASSFGTSTNTGFNFVSQNQQAATGGFNFNAAATGGSGTFNFGSGTNSTFGSSPAAFGGTPGTVSQPGGFSMGTGSASRSMVKGRRRGPRR